jgi:hypothetical protein
MFVFGIKGRGDLSYNPFRDLTCNCKLHILIGAKPLKISTTRRNHSAVRTHLVITQLFDLMLPAFKSARNHLAQNHSVCMNMNRYETTRDLQTQAPWSNSLARCSTDWAKYLNIYPKYQINIYILRQLF